MSSERLVTKDGYPIAVDRFDAKANASARAGAVAILAPAMGVPRRFYAPIARWLATQGVTTYTMDYRGMGESRPPDLRGFEATIVDWATLDCAAVIDDASARFPDAAIYWVGHSVGSQILALIPNRDRIRAMLSIAAGSGYYRSNAAPLRYYVLSYWYAIMPLAVRVYGYFPGRKLRMVGDLPRGVAEQWRRWCLSPDYLAVESDAVREALGAVETPITALSIVDDEMMTLRGTRELFGLYAKAPVEIQRLDPADVGLDAIGHFGFFRAKMEATLWPMIPAWIDRMAEPRIGAEVST